MNMSGLNDEISVAIDPDVIFYVDIEERRACFMISGEIKDVRVFSGGSSSQALTQILQCALNKR
jgi:hypothetical protein